MQVLLSFLLMRVRDNPRSPAEAARLASTISLEDLGPSTDLGYDEEPQIRATTMMDDLG